MTKLQTGNQFIKVIDQDVAEFLQSLGFSYMKDGSFYAFVETPELISVLQQKFEEVPMIVENKLRF